MATRPSSTGRGGSVLDTIFTVRCAGCDAVGSALCQTCRFALVDASAMARSHDVGASGDVIAALSLTGTARRVIHGLKYRNRRRVADHLAGLLLPRLIEVGVNVDPVLTAITWAPTHAGRRRDRGYDQAELVARSVARMIGLPAVRLLERVDAAGPQTGLSRIERSSNPAFRGRRSRHRGVILIDDVVTTGSTLAAARGALRTAGVEHICSAAVAAAPLSVPGVSERILSTAA